MLVNQGWEISIEKYFRKKKIFFTRFLTNRLSFEIWKIIFPSSAWIYMTSRSPDMAYNSLLPSNRLLILEKNNFYWRRGAHAVGEGVIINLKLRIIGAEPMLIKTDARLFLDQPQAACNVPITASKGTLRSSGWSWSPSLDNMICFPFS